MSRSSEMQGWRSHRQGGRILWAITANDLRAALKNKNVVVIILTALVMVLFYRFYPGLAGGLETPRLLVYAEGQNGLVPLLEESQALKVYAYPSEEGLMRALANTDVPVIGLVLPVGFDQEMGAAQPVQLQGYVMHWMSSAEASEQEGLVETEIALLLGRPVEVQTEGNHVYPRPDSHGLSTTLGISLVYVILMTALPMIPHLFLEEKKARTMDALLVSPASAGQIVAGKAFSGLFYCLAGAVIALVVYWNVIVHLWLAVLAIACGSLFTVALGLWLGMRVEDRGQMSMALWIVLIPLLIPIFCS